MTNCKIIFRTCGVYASYNNEEYQLVFEYDLVPTFKMHDSAKNSRANSYFYKRMI